MTEDERRRAFAEAFIAQARSDWGVHRMLAERTDVPVCHALHYLQMACEKVAKAYRLRDTRSPVEELLSKHTGFEKFVGPFLTAVLKGEYEGKDAQFRGLIQRARVLARQIEKLAPAVDRAEAPEKRGVSVGARRPRDRSLPPRVPGARAPAATRRSRVSQPRRASSR